MNSNPCLCALCVSERQRDHDKKQHVNKELNSVTTAEDSLHRALEVLNQARTELREVQREVRGFRHTVDQSKNIGIKVGPFTIYKGDENSIWVWHDSGEAAQIKLTPEWWASVM